jgi:hypothetical protein
MSSRSQALAEPETESDLQSVCHILGVVMRGTEDVTLLSVRFHCLTF